MDKLSLKETSLRIAEIKKRLSSGCGNNGCIIKKPTGMATNGPCRCGPWHLARELRHLADLIDRPGSW